MGMLDKKSTLLCFFHFHDLDDNCRCRRCGRIVHRYRTYHEWRAEGGIDAGLGDGGVWLRYDEVEYEIRRCRRCGKVLSEARTGRLRGSNP